MKLKTFLILYNIKPAVLAKKLKISERSVYNYLSGKPCSKTIARKIAKFSEYDVSVEELI